MVECNTRAFFCKNKMEEEVSRFPFLLGQIDEFVDEQEIKKGEEKPTETLAC